MNFMSLRSFRRLKYLISQRRGRQKLEKLLQTIHNSVLFYFINNHANHGLILQMSFSILLFCPRNFIVYIIYVMYGIVSQTDATDNPVAKFIMKYV